MIWRGRARLKAESSFLRERQDAAGLALSSYAELLLLLGFSQRLLEVGLPAEEIDRRGNCPAQATHFFFGQLPSSIR